MSNFDLYKQWAERYAQRVSQGQPDKGGKGKKADSKPDAGSQPDSNATTPLVVPHTFGSASFLKGQFGKDFLKEYNARVKKDYNNASALQVLNWDDANQKVTGSNPFAVVLSNMILEKSGIRTATQAELEKIAQANTLPIKGNHYVESSLVWRSNADPNSWLALDFYDQFRGAGKPLKENTAYVLPLYGLSLRKENKAPNKLAFNLKKELLYTPLYFEAHILMSKDGLYVKAGEVDTNTGLPKKVYENAVPGNRQLWTRNSGLSRLYLIRDLDLFARGGVLAGSYEAGRVVCISGAAAAQKP